MLGLILILALIVFAVLKRKSKKVWVLLDYAILAGLLLVPVICLAQTATVAYVNVANPPDDIGAFINWLFTSAGAVKGHGSMAISALIITVLMGILKMTALKSLFDKLGNYKIIVPMALGAIAELLTNYPSPATLATVLSVIVTGASGTGLISVAYHHALDNLVTPPAA